MLEIGGDPNDVHRWGSLSDTKAQELCIKYGADAYGEFREAVKAGKYDAEIKANKARVKKNMERLGIKPKSNLRTELKSQKGSDEKNKNLAAVDDYRFDKAAKIKASSQKDMVAVNNFKEQETKQTTLTPEIIRQNSGNSLG